MPWSLESHLAFYAPHDRRLLLKWSALYAETFKQKVFGETGRSAATGEEILALTLGKLIEGSNGYVFREADILLFRCLCRCCRKTVLALHRGGPADDAEGSSPLQEEDEAALVLTEPAALQFLERSQSLAAFLAFVAASKLQGKLRAYATGFPGYAQQSWDEHQIAKSLRTTPIRVAAFRSRLRELLEEFELQRVRASTNPT